MPYSIWLARTPTWLAASLLGLIAIVPFVQPLHRLPLPSFYSEWLAILLGVVACIPLVTRTFWKYLCVPKTTVYFFVFALFAAAQSFWVHHAYLSQALLPALYLSWAGLLAVLALWLRTQLGAETSLRVFAWFMLCGGILHALFGLAQFLDHPGYLEAWVDYNPPDQALSGNIAQANHYATQVTLATVALVYLFALGRCSASLAFPLVALFVFVLTLSASRAVLLYLIGIVFLSALAFHQTRKPFHLRLTAITAFVLSLFVLALYLLPPFSQWLHQVLVDLGFRGGTLKLLTALQKGAVSGIDLRVSEWHKAWLMFLQSPLGGVGFGHYGWHSFTYQALPEFSALEKPSLFHHSHNLFFQVAAETGAVGLLLLLALLTGWLKQYVKHWKEHANWFVGACLLVLFIHSNLEYPLWYSYFLGIAAFLLGISDTRTLQIKFTPRLGQAASAVSLTLIAAILIFTYSGYQALAQVNALIHQTKSAHAAIAVHAVATNPLLRPWAEQLLATHGAPDKKSITRQLALTTRVMEHHPNPVKVRRQIEYLAFADQMDKAISLLEVAAAAYPTHLPGYACEWQKNSAPETQAINKRALELIGDEVVCETNVQYFPGPSTAPLKSLN